MKWPHKMRAKGSRALVQERNFSTCSEDRKMSAQKREKVGEEKRFREEMIGHCLEEREPFSVRVRVRDPERS